MKGYREFTARLPSLRWVYCRLWFLKSRRPDLAAKKVIPDNKRCSQIKAEMESHIAVILRDRELTALQLTNLFSCWNLWGNLRGFLGSCTGMRSFELLWEVGRMTPQTSGWSNVLMIFMENKKMVSKEGREVEVCVGKVALLVEWGSEPLQTGFSVIQVLCHSCWAKRLTDTVKTMHQRCLSDRLKACWKHEIAGFRFSVEVRLWFIWKTKSFWAEKW